MKRRLLAMLLAVPLLFVLQPTIAAAIATPQQADTYQPTEEEQREYQNALTRIAEIEAKMAVIMREINDSAAELFELLGVSDYQLHEYHPVVKHINALGEQLEQIEANVVANYKEGKILGYVKGAEYNDGINALIAELEHAYNDAMMLINIQFITSTCDMKVYDVLIPTIEQDFPGFDLSEYIDELRYLTECVRLHYFWGETAYKQGNIAVEYDSRMEECVKIMEYIDGYYNIVKEKYYAELIEKNNAAYYADLRTLNELSKKIEEAFHQVGHLNAEGCRLEDKAYAAINTAKKAIKEAIENANANYIEYVTSDLIKVAEAEVQKFVDYCTTTGIESVEAANEIEAIYTLDGKKVDGIVKGAVNIVRYRNGEVRKIK